MGASDRLWNMLHCYHSAYNCAVKRTEKKTPLTKTSNVLFEWRFSVRDVLIFPRGTYVVHSKLTGALHVNAISRRALKRPVTKRDLIHNPNYPNRKITSHQKPFLFKRTETHVKTNNFLLKQVVYGRIQRND